MSVHVSIVPQLNVEPPPPPPPPSQPLWWIPHDRFRYDYDDRDREHSQGWAFNPSGTGEAREVTQRTGQSMPEVYRFDPEHSTRLDEGWQNLLVGLNPDLTRDKALSLLGTGLAWCNAQDNVFDQPRLTGGAVVTGREDANLLWIKSMLTSQPVPSAEEVLADRTLWYWATGVQPDGDINLFRRKGRDGNMYPVRMFIVTREPIWVRLDEVLRLPDGFIPHPQWMPGKSII